MMNRRFRINGRIKSNGSTLERWDAPSQHARPIPPLVDKMRPKSDFGLEVRLVGATVEGTCCRLPHLHPAFRSGSVSASSKEGV